MKLQSMICSLILSLGIQTVQAANLIQVYNQALKNDPSFKQAQATWLAAKENLPIAQANLLPSLDFTAGIERNYQKINPSATHGYFNSANYGLTIKQPLFNWAAWSGVKNVRAALKAATATYMAAAQNLMVRAALAYFSVLKAADELRYTEAQKQAVWRQLEESRQKYKVGLIAITPVYDAKASYDKAVANEIADRNTLDNAMENLRAITNHGYHALSSLNQQVPLFIPHPHHIMNWTDTALKQNYKLKAQEYQLQADHEMIELQASTRYPNLTLQASYSVNHYSNYATVQKPNTKGAAIGIALDFPFYQGGAISAKVKQAEYNYQNSSATLEFVYRDVIKKTRQAYLGVVAGISGIKAAHQAVISNENSLKATKAGYAVGTRTMVDVLAALSQLYQAQKIYTQNQYSYINNLISLKAQAGTLGVKDLEQINSWLKKAS